MNNNILKILRRTLLCTVAAVVSIGFTACADEMFETQNVTAPADGYKICIPANMGGGQTRAIAYNSQTGGYDATFETTDKISVYDVNKKAMGIGSLKPDAAGKSTNLVGTLVTFRDRSDQDVLPEVGDELLLLYKAAYFDYSRDFSSQWDIEPDYAIATATITAINDGVLNTSPASFENYQSIYKINFTGIGSDVKIKKMMISSANQKLVNYCYPYHEYPDINSIYGDVTYTYKDEGTVQREMTFMLRFSDRYQDIPELESTPGDEITFRALGSDGRYYSGIKSVTDDLENGKYYYADVAMEHEGLAMTLTNHATGEVVVDSWAQINTKNAAYTLANIGYNSYFEWYGGENELTLRNVSLSTRNNAISVFSVEDDIENTKNHYLVLDGVNTLNCSDGDYTPHAIVVSENCSLSISATSAAGKLNMPNTIGLSSNSTLTIQRGEITLGDGLMINDNSILNVEGGVLTCKSLWGDCINGGCIISNSGSVRIPKDAYVEEGIIKAASGYVLLTAEEDDYTVYMVSPAPDPIALSAVTTDDIGKIIASDGNVYVPNYGFSDNIRPIGMITSISSTGHGLAFSMDEVKVRMHDVENDWYYDGVGFTWDNTGKNNNGKTATEIFDEWKANHSVTFGTWRFATAAEWQQMALNFRIEGDATEAVDIDMVAEGLVRKLKQSRIFGDYDYFSYWTGEPTEEEGRLTSIFVDIDYWDEVSQETYQGPSKLRVIKWNTPEYNHHILPVLEF